MLRKIFSILVLATIALAACVPGEGLGTPGLTEPPPGTEPVGTETIGTEPVGTEPAITEPVETEPVVTEPAETEVVPPTGDVDAGRLSNLLDFEVWSQEGEVIGDVDDIVIDFDAKAAAYVVMTSREDSRLIPIPWEALTVTTAEGETVEGPQNAFSLNVDMTVVESAPEIDLATVPETGADVAGWDSEIASYWDAELGGGVAGTPVSTPAGTEESATPIGTPEPAVTVEGTEEVMMEGLHGVILASQFFAAEIQGEAEAVGSVDDVILEPGSGAVQYVVIAASSQDTGQRLVPVPLEVLGWDAEAGALILAVDQATFEDAPAFEGNEYPQTAESGWDDTFSEYWAGILPAETP